MAIKVSDIAKVNTTLSSDPSPTLSGDLDINDNSIINTSGPVNIDGINYPEADGTNGQVVTTDGLGSLGFSSIPAVPANSDFSLARLSDTTLIPLANGYLRWNALADTVLYQANIPATEVSGLAVVATTGVYNDLIDKPSIPANSDFSFVGLSDTSVTGITGDTYLKWNSAGDQVIYATTVPVADVTGLATVATSGSYDDLSNQPNIPVNIGDLADVVTSGVTTNQGLIWSGSEWANSFSDYGDIINTPDLSVYALISSLSAVATDGLFNSLIDIDVGTASLGDSIIFNDVSGNWEPGLPSSTVALLGDVGNVDTTTVAPTDGQVIKWNQSQSEWLPADDLTSGGVGDTLGSLNDVTIAAPADKNYLIYDFGSLMWRNLVPSYNDLSDRPVVPAVLDDLTDVDTTTSPPQLNDVLVFNGANWAPEEPVTVAEERIFYVTVGGSDATGDGSRFKPYSTLEKGVTEAKLLAVADDALVGILIGPGNYPENNPVIIDDWRIIISASVISSTTITALNNGPVLRLASQDASAGPVLEGVNLSGLDRTAGNHGIEFDDDGVFRLYAVNVANCDAAVGSSAVVPAARQAIFWNLSNSGTCNYAVRTIHPLTSVSVADCEFVDMFVATFKADQGSILAKPATITNTNTRGGGAVGLDAVAGTIFAGMTSIKDCETAVIVSGTGDVTINSVDFINNTADFVQSDITGTGSAINSNFDLSKSTFLDLGQFDVSSNIVTGGKNVYLFAAEGGTVEVSGGRIVASQGPETTPAYGFGSGDGQSINDDNTGMYSPSENIIGFSTNGAARVTINQTGVVNVTGSLTIQDVSLAGVATTGTINSLIDVDAATPGDKQILVYNNTSGLWEAIDDVIKADKVISAIAGNFAGLDATGNLTDSGFNSTSFASAAQGGLADSALQNGDNVSELVNDALYVAEADTIDGGSY